MLKLLVLLLIVLPALSASFTCSHGVPRLANRTESYLSYCFCPRGWIGARCDLILPFHCEIALLQPPIQCPTPSSPSPTHPDFDPALIGPPSCLPMLSSPTASLDLHFAARCSFDEPTKEGPNVSLSGYEFDPSPPSPPFLYTWINTSSGFALTPDLSPSLRVSFINFNRLFDLSLSLTNLSNFAFFRANVSSSSFAAAVSDPSLPSASLPTFSFHFTFSSSLPAGFTAGGRRAFEATLLLTSSSNVSAVIPPRPYRARSDRFYITVQNWHPQNQSTYRTLTDADIFYIVAGIIVFLLLVLWLWHKCCRHSEEPEIPQSLHIAAQRKQAEEASQRTDTQKSALQQSSLHSSPSSEPAFSSSLSHRRRERTAASESVASAVRTSLSS